MDDNNSPVEAMKVLRESRRLRGDSLRAAAEKLQVNKSTVSKIENGHIKPGRDLSLRIWDFYGVAPWMWSGERRDAKTL